MRDPRLDKLATLLVEHTAKVRPNDLVTIVADPAAFAAGGVEALYEAVLRAGAHPSYHVRSQRLQEILLRRGSDAQIQHVCPFEEHRLAHCDVLIFLNCPSNTRFLGAIDPAKPALLQAARRALLAMSLERKASGASRYAMTEIPGPAAAQEADMSLADYEDLVYRAALLHLPDPAAAWRRLHNQHLRAIEFLRTKQTLRFRAPPSDGRSGSSLRPHDGTDLTVDVSGQTWISCAGNEHIADGEIMSGPRAVDGVVNFSFPSIYKGKEVDAIRLRFKAGRVVDASAAKNQAYLFALLDQDEGARTAGEIALGTNYHLPSFIRNAFFDEKIGGTFHLALGAGYPETGNTNQSALHWDLVCDLRPPVPALPGGTIEADGQVIQRDGRFLLEGWPGLD